MPSWLIVALSILVGPPLVWLVLRTVARAVRLREPRPMPHWFAPVIDNPLRRLANPPDRTVAELGVEPGMRVLEVGPGHGSYTLAAARRIGESGRLVAVDVQEEIVERLRRRAEREGMTNLEARLADVHALPFADGRFDLVYMITVVGEIPEPVAALREFRRVLRAGGRLVCAEFFPDPDYPPAKTLRGWGEEAGFSFEKKRTGLLTYAMSFTKPDGG
jgi:ubiquinone/menaquinone biosynthesis C-methylase UbiE